MRTLFLLPLLACAAWSQATPVDCSPGLQTFTSATAGSRINNANSSLPCVSWRVTYDTTGFSVISIQFETSPDGTTWTAVPNNTCSSTVAPPCVIDGANPSTTTGNGTFSIRAYGVNVRVNVTTATGSGTIHARIFGYKGLSASAGTGGGGTTLSSTTGLQYFPWGTTADTNTNTYTIDGNNNVYIWVFETETAMKIGHVVWHVVAGNPGGGGTAFAIYDVNKNLLGQTTPYTSASGSQYVSSAMSAGLTFGPGLFYFAWTADNTTVSWSLTGADTPANQLMNVTAQRTGRCANTSTGTGSSVVFPATCGVITDKTFNALPFVTLEP